MEKLSVSLTAWFSPGFIRLTVVTLIDSCCLATCFPVPDQQGQQWYLSFDCRNVQETLASSIFILGLVPGSCGGLFLLGVFELAETHRKGS